MEHLKVRDVVNALGAEVFVVRLELFAIQKSNIFKIKGSVAALVRILSLGLRILIYLLICEAGGDFTLVASLFVTFLG